MKAPFAPEKRDNQENGTTKVSATFKVNNEWKDLAGRFSNASPAIKQALELMRTTRYVD